MFYIKIKFRLEKKKDWRGCGLDQVSIAHKDWGVTKFKSEKKEKKYSAVDKIW